MANWLVSVLVSLSVLVTFMGEALWVASDLCVLCKLGGGVFGSDGGDGGGVDELSVIVVVIDIADFCDECSECVADDCVSVCCFESFGFLVKVSVSVLGELLFNACMRLCLLGRVFE